MSHIQMTDRNPSGLEPMEELTDRELLAINGGCCCAPPILPTPPKISFPRVISSRGPR